MARASPPSTHELSETENGRIYSERIEPALLETVTTPQPAVPRLIMLGGQPGSGKTSRLRFDAEDELRRDGAFIAIDADHLRTYHPEWDDLNQQDDRNAALLTHPDAAQWVSRAIDTAIREGCHVVFDGTMGFPQAAIDRIEKFEQAGYEIEIRVLAVNERLSWLGVLRRYEEAKARRAFGRMTPRQAHDEAHEGLVRSLERIESEKPMVRIRLYSLDKTLVLDTTNAAAYGGRTAVEALQDERNRPWTSAEHTAFRSEVDKLVRLATDRGADATAIEEYRAV